VSDFYNAALNEAEQALLDQARDRTALDDEIALLRVKLQTLAVENPQDIARFLKLLDLLRRMVGTQYRISKKAERDLSESIVNVITGLGGALGLGEDRDVP
jgi:hypothetical protein